MLEHKLKVNNIYSEFADNMSRVRLNYIFHEAKQADNKGSDNSKLGCILMKIYGLPCACFISKKVKLDSPIRIDEVYTH